MKKIITFMFLLLLAMSATGCAQPRGTDPEPPGADRVIYPAPVTDWLERAKPMFLAGHLKAENTDFVMVNWGEKPTAGYEVRIDEVIEEPNRVVVKVEFIYPGEAAAQTLTNPHVVEALNFDLTGREIVFEDINDREYIPRVVGVEGLPAFLPQEAPNIKLFNFVKEPGMVRVTGIARAFEANINYDLEDDKKNVLQSGFDMAATAGPDWGYFEFQLDNIPENADSLVIYTVNMEDGSRWEVIVLKL
ncbi:MAG: Gmad2 immunoglobulin-like domain-containing protein [Bacillota bacterium]